jgi:2-amino-4-hydroxy-6-hydroxymethyldihydropteridine diphosphokinase
MTTCLLALGSNLGDRHARLNAAIAQLSAHSAVTLSARSAWFLTPPIGGPPGQGEFVNAAVRVDTTLAPAALLELLRTIEQRLGRQRHERWDARSVDLDLLLYGEHVVRTPPLTIPHPRMAFRRFVLEPAAEVAPEMRHPVLGWTVQRLLEHLNTAANYVALAGGASQARSQLAQQVAEQAGIRLLADPLSATGSEFELLQRRGGLLDAAHWPPGQTATISDFWLGQSLALSRYERPSGGTSFPGRPDVPEGPSSGSNSSVGTGGSGRSSKAEALAELRKEWQRCQPCCVAPKLIVLLPASEPTTASGPALGRDPLGCTPYDFGPRPDDAIRELLWHDQHGPFLELDAARPDTHVPEIIAAIEAMR